jgi:hypothetical protein
MVITRILIFIFLIFIFYQDYKYRAVSWILFPIGFILFAAESIHYGDLYEQALIFLLNIGICLFVFILLLIYFSIKNKKITNIIDHYIGLGDLLFIIIISIGFSAINFILFLNISLFFILIMYLALYKVLKFKNDKIPFAGLLSLFYLVYFVLNNFWFQINPYIDLKIISFLGNE